MSNLPANQSSIASSEIYDDSHSYECYVELMLSAGPRKEKDTELGEDVAGAFVKSAYAFFWIADGTSESPYLRDEQNKVNFSSRLLAQELSISFRERIFDVERTELNKDKDIIKKIVEDCLTNVLQNWNKTLENISPESRKYLDEIFDQRQGASLDFSTTFLGGSLSRSGTLQVAFYGDSPLFIKQGDKSFIIRESNYRFFLRLSKNNDDYIFSTSKEHPIKNYTYEKVDIVVAGSDGVGKLTEFVQAQIKSFSFREIWNRIHRFSPQTNDDKSICIVARYRK